MTFISTILWALERIFQEMLYRTTKFNLVNKRNEFFFLFGALHTNSILKKFGLDPYFITLKHIHLKSK